MAFMAAVVMLVAAVPPVVPMGMPMLMLPVVPFVLTLVRPLVMLPMVGASIEEKRVINNQREDTKEEPGRQDTSFTAVFLISVCIIFAKRQDMEQENIFVVPLLMAFPPLYLEYEYE